ncbi:LysM peptidoglycan-binding domain-containing protein [Bacillus sp. CMF21]|nr:LysM peptidoglycan-binding domain-containing protein [Bacillus sp. CMF21]
MSKKEEAASTRASRQNNIDEYKTRTGSYPSRSEIHNKDKKKSKYKYPAISLLALFFFLLPIVFYYSISYFDNRGKTVNGENISDYEDVLIKYGDEEEEEEQEQSSDEQSLEESEEKTHEAEQASISSAQTNVNKQAEEAPLKIAAEKEQQPEKKEATVQPEPQKMNRTTEPNRTVTVTEPKEEYKVIEHTVGPEENLFRISVKYYRDRSGEAIIKQWNQLSGDSVYEGQVLKIPLKQ